MRQTYTAVLDSEGEDDLFVCDVCEAILVSEKGIVEHMQTQHGMDINITRQESKTSNREPEPLEDHNSETSETSEDSGDEGGAEGAGASKIDMTFVERQFYVCCHCDDIFLDKQRLHVHININHDHTEKENDSSDSDASTIDSPPQSPKPKRFKRRVTEDVGLKASEVSRLGNSQTQTYSEKENDSSTARDKY